MIMKKQKNKTNLLHMFLAIFKRSKYSMWIDVGCFDVSGKYYLMQMQFNLSTNKKRFRRAKMGFINDNTSKSELYTNTKKYNI